MSYKKLGKYITLIDNRNKELSDAPLLGVSVQKRFIPSIANTIGSDMSKYKLIERNNFVYIADTSRRGDKIGIALLKEFDKAMISQAYTSFKIIDENELSPDYLMMWFSRPEFDRYARYHSIGSVREVFDWKDMCEVELPIPSIEKQREIVAQYQAVENKIRVNEAICEKLEATAQALYKHWFVDFEFPFSDTEASLSDTVAPLSDTEALEVSGEAPEVSGEALEVLGEAPEVSGVASRASATRGYKSSGGKMVWNEELGKEIPEGWEVKEFQTIAKVTSGKKSKGDLGTKYPIYGAGGITGYSDDYLFNEKIIIIGRVGTHGKVFIEYEKSYPSDNTLVFTPENLYFSYFILKFLNYDELNKGGVQALLTQTDLKQLKVLLPNFDLKLFENYVEKPFILKSKIEIENQKLTQLQSLLLSRLAVGEEERKKITV
ncbi:restriction endonuclease subunit S [Flavobacterium sp. CBA20B-1]|uniref:restriction endonuclease subunit S n=1 Tax=unclassified Flavobacterium TaxID=196869 RepID=UPI002224EEFD|nr:MULTISPECIES: restriction endonuclease subunit S [unclassified Flavobacterium]WCM42360.1 restriction endonuclease subunit S [Flavobacterium sp. CBA20B-1]